MNLGEKEVAILIAMHKAVAITEQNALTFKEIVEACGMNISSGKLVDLRSQSLLRSTGGSLNKWWLTPAGVERAELEIMDSELKEPECPASVGGDVDPDKVEAVEAVAEPVVNENSLVAGFVLGDRGFGGTQLFTEDDKLLAFDDLAKATEYGKQACVESAYDFEVYALVPIGKFQSRTVVDWVPAGA